MIVLALGAGLTLIAGALFYQIRRTPGDSNRASASATSISSSASTIELAPGKAALSYAPDKLPEPAGAATATLSDGPAAAVDTAEAKRVSTKKSKRSTKKTHDFGF